jgi:hypothetical protein
MPRERDVQYATLLTSRARREAGIIRDPQEFERVQHLVDPYNRLPVASEPKPYPSKESLRQERKEFSNIWSWYLRVPINIGRALAMIYRGGPIVNQLAVPKYNIVSEQNALVRFAKGMYNIGRWFIKELVESFRQDYRDFINLFRNK